RWPRDWSSDVCSSDLAFLTDLKARGLFDDTLVLWGGEFGRTPVAELPALNGRDHNHYGFTCWLAGGGVKGGTAVGATDEFGFRAVENPVHVHDLHATMLHLRELAPEQITGRVILIPTLTMPAAKAATRLSPLDGKNFNRCFPGSPTGTPSEVVAHYLTTVLFPLADVVIDIHTGGRSMD